MTNELYHYGIKGMKWGVRRSKEQLRYNRYSITAKLSRRLHSIQTPNGIKVKTISEHALDRIEQDDDRKVDVNDITNALKKPMHITKERIDKQGRRSVQYIGRQATVAVNPKTGNIPSVWITGKRMTRKYGGNKV